MKPNKHYCVHLVGNTDTVKRMTASIYLADAKKKRQVMKVSICDDLPHVVNAIQKEQKSSPNQELLESGLMLQVAYGRSLTIRVNITDDYSLCRIAPQQEVEIPTQAIWESNTALATDFNIELERPYEDALLQVSFTSKDDYGSDIPLNVPPRVRISWRPKDIAGVQRIRKTWEMTEAQRGANEASTLPRNPHSPTHKKSGSLPRYQQPTYLGIEKMLQDRPQSKPQDTMSPKPQGRISPQPQSRFSPRLQGRVSPRFQGHLSSRPNYADKPTVVQDKNWNVVNSPTSNVDEELPKWAKGYGDAFDYEDVVVV
ncbi:unnamed protein product [Clavelina lepadiformis]|uniref:Uncharacterized protein n=1 Tax=Clavelina lepadiformis TaxID=159417 RepID=A0ABP0GSN8_CLALP